MKEQLLDELKELAKTILNTTELSSEQLKNRSQQLYESAILLTYAEKKELDEAPSKQLIIEESILELAAKKIVDKESEDLGLLETTGAIKKEAILEELPTFDIEKRVLDVSFEPAPIQDNKEISTPEKLKDTSVEAPKLLEELENLTSDFTLPEFEASKNEENIEPQTKVSLNDVLHKGFQIGLNDRLAFVNNLFNGSNEDLTRVISQLNTKENLTEAQEFVSQIVKPEYNNWQGKEAFEIRFLELVERNFQ